MTTPTKSVTRAEEPGRAAVSERWQGSAGKGLYKTRHPRRAQHSGQRAKYGEKD